MRNHSEEIEIVKKYWENNSESWRDASRSGIDVWRDHLNTPAFLKMLPDLTEKQGLDVGCGEGYNSRLIAKRCKKLIGIDIVEGMFENEKEPMENLSFQVASAAELPFLDNHFDFVVSTMAFMDMPNIEGVFREAYRVLKKDGFLQFSILHPCFNEFKGGWLQSDKAWTFVMSDYFTETRGEVDEWKHYYASSQDQSFKVPRFFRPLNKWLNSLIEAGFLLKEIKEPYATEEDVQKYPALFTTRIVAHSLIIRATK